MVRRSRDIDGGWAWVIMFCAFACHVLQSGPFLGAGFLAVALKDTFNTSLAIRSLPGSLLGCLYNLIGPFTSWLMHRLGWRLTVILGSIVFCGGLVITAFATTIWHVVAGYGVICGIGIGFFYVPTYVAVGHYFNKKRAFATGLACTGSGIGLALFPILLETLGKHYGWRGALLILAGLTLHMCVAGALLRPLPQEDSTDQSSKPSFQFFKELKYVMQTGAFYCLNLHIFFIAAGVTSVYLHLPSFSVAAGSTISEVAWITSTIGITIVFGRIIIPYLVTRVPLNTMWTVFVALALTSVGCFTLPFYIKSYAATIGFAATFGFFGMSYGSFSSQFIVEYIGLKYIGTVYGVNLFWYGIGSVIAPPLLGSLVDITGIYDFSFYTAGVFLLLAALVLLPLPVLRKKHLRKKLMHNGSVKVINGIS